MQSQFVLLRDRRFLPLFITQFLGAFNDNLLKAFIVVLVAYGQWDIGTMRPDVLVSLAAALFILPFIVFCPIAGDLTDKFDKAKIIKATKILEVVIAFMAVFTIYQGSITLAFFVLFLLGVQSAFFSPGKFSILPQLLSSNELIGANGLMSTGTYLAILSGTIIGTLFALNAYGAEIISTILMLCALAGFFASCKIPSAPSANPDKHISLNPFGAIYSTLRYTLTMKHGVLAAILATSWFYFVAGTIHTQFPNFAKQSLGVDTDVLTMFMVIFSLGIAVGGLLNNKLLKSVISGRLVPWAALMIVVFSADLYFASTAYFSARSPLDLGGGDLASGEAFDTISIFFSNIHAWRIVADLFLLSLAGGLYVVPLRAIVQDRSPKENTSRVVAGNSLSDSLFLLLSSLFGAALLSLGWLVKDLFLMLSIMTLIVAIMLFRHKEIYTRQNHGQSNID
ncbi:MAG: MFS transporter [Alphaproteobacteria bacterium]